jgi:hypothetical protein
VNFSVVIFPMQMAVVVNTFLTKKQSVVEGWTGRQTDTAFHLQWVFQICHSDSGVAEYSVFVGCDAASSVM